MNIPSVPEENKFVNITKGTRMHPFGMHKLVNLNTVEVVQSVTDDDNHPRRYVLLEDGDYEVWVKRKDKEDYGYELQDDERLPQSEFDAIVLKHRAMKEDPEITLETVQDEITNDTPPRALEHLIIAAFYAAKADPDLPSEAVDQLRDYMHEHTRHVDTSHKPTLKRILEENLNSTEKAPE